MKLQTLLVTAILIASFHGQEKQADPYRTPAVGPDGLPDPGPPPNMSVCYEAFSLPLAMAATFQREQLADSALYAKLISEIGKESVRQAAGLCRRGATRTRRLDYFPDSRTLDQHVFLLRKKIEADPANPRIIQTVRAVGYRCL